MGISDTRKFLSQSLIFLGLGAGLMYLFDPEQGEGRRTRLRNLAVGARHDAEHFVDARTEEVRNRAAGTVTDVANRISVIADEAERLVRSLSSLIGAYRGTSLASDVSTAASAGGSRKTTPSMNPKSDIVDEQSS